MIHFRLEEFKCPCCGANDMEPSTLKKLDRARDFAGVAFAVNSGFRCRQQNAKVGGKADSAHMRGFAVDISATNSRNRFLIIYGLVMAGFTRIGIGNNFIHADDDPDKPGEVAWLYGERS